MAKTLDFNTLKKQHLPIVLADDENTKLFICTPTKKILDSFLNMRDSLTTDNMDDEALNELYDIVAKVMSHNKAGKKITREKVESVFDFEDILIFIRAYTDFISEVTGSKN